MRKLLYISLIFLSSGFGFTLAHFFNPKKEALDLRPFVVLSSSQLIPIKKRISTIGTVKALHDVQISPSVSGKIDKIYFQSGQKVVQGQLLVELQNADLKSSLDFDLAKYQYAANQYSRYTRLFKTGAVALADLDQFKLAAVQTRAQYLHDKALLEKTCIRAPFSGTMGIRHVELGQFINPGTPIATLEDRSQLWLNFSLPQTQASLIKVGQLIQIYTSSSLPLNTFAKVRAIGVKMSENTRFLNFQAELLSPNVSIIPGGFVKLELILEGKKKGVFIPENAISYGPNGESIYVYQNSHVNKVFVKTGAHVDGMIEIVKGLKHPVWVVKFGQSRLHDNESVRVST